MQPGQPGQPGQTRPSLRPQPEDPSRGCACTLFAVVDANGDLVREFRANSSQRFSTGEYEVVFNRSVSQCAYVATIGDPGDNVIPPPGEIAVAGRLNDDTAVFITTYDSNGRRADRGFHLAVHCRPNR
jgi:hypothetical protein